MPGQRDRDCYWCLAFPIWVKANKNKEAKKGEAQPSRPHDEHAQSQASAPNASSEVGSAVVSPPGGLVVTAKDEKEVSKAGKLQFCCKTLGGPASTLRVDEDDLVYQLHVQYEKLQGVPRWMVRFGASGQLLLPHEPLAKYKLAVLRS